MLRLEPAVLLAVQEALAFQREEEVVWLFQVPLEVA
jgi:hypothetical protein